MRNILIFTCAYGCQLSRVWSCVLLYERKKKELSEYSIYVHKTVQRQLQWHWPYYIFFTVRHRCHRRRRRRQASGSSKILFIEWIQFQRFGFFFINEDPVSIDQKYTHHFPKNFFFLKESNEQEMKTKRGLGERLEKGAYEHIKWSEERERER